MARAQSTDMFQGFRFHVRIVEQAGTGYGLQPAAKEASDARTSAPEAGFQNVTLPEVSVEPAEYREGIFSYTQKYPGPQTYSTMSLMRGVTKSDTAFWEWTKRTWEGEEYRADLEVMHFSRMDVPNGYKKDETTAARSYLLYECIPARAKPGPDLDPTSGEVAIQEMDIECEFMEVSVDAVEV